LNKMSTSIGRLAYVATWDATSLTKGVLSAQQLFREQKKITESMRSPLDRYNDGLKNLENVTAKYPAIAKHQVEIGQQLERAYLREVAALRSLTQEEQKRMNILTAEERAAERSKVAEEKRIRAKEDALNRERRLQQQSIENRRKSGQGERNADEKRQRDEAENVRRHREALMQRLRDRKNHDEQMRQQIQKSLKYWEQESKMLAGKSSVGGPAAGGAGGGGLMMGRAAMALGRGGLAGLAVGGAVAGANAINNGDAANANRDIERTQAAFTTFAGSLERSNAMIEQMRNLSAATGVSFNAFSQGSKMLMMMGTSADEVLPLMKNVSVVTGGNADAMVRMGRAIGQTANMGRLMAEELNQMVDAGWSPARAIMRRYNIDMLEFRKRMEEGRISALMLKQALVDDVSEGGQYFGYFENLEGTSARTYDKMSAAWERMNADMGQAMEPLSNTWTALLTDVADQVGRIGRKWQEFNKWIGAASVAVEKADPGPAISNKAKEREARLQSERDRVAAVLARQQKELEDEKSMGMSALPGMELATLRDSGIVSSEDLAKFDKYTSLMNDFHKEQATIDFAANRNLDVVLGYLDKEVQAELKRLDAMEKQFDVEKKRQDLVAASEEVAKQYGPKNDPMVEKLKEIELARQLGVMDDKSAKMAQQDIVAGSGPGSSSELAPNAGVNSQEAYAFFAQLQDRNTKMQLKKQQEQITLQKSMLDVMKQVKTALDELEPIGSGG